MNDLEQNHSPSLLVKLRINFIYGLVVILPVFATVWLVLFFIEWITGPASTLIGPGVPKLLSFFITLIFILIIGFVAENYIGKFILGCFNSIVGRLPIVGTIYRSSQQIITAFSLNNKKNLIPVMIEYPKNGLWALGFITQENVSGIKDINDNAFGEDKVAVFVPTTPNPTSGYFVYSDKNAILRLNMTVEESIKLLMSAGFINPSQFK